MFSHFHEKVALAIKQHPKRYASIFGGIVVALGIAWFAIPKPQAQGALKGHTVEIYRNAQISINFSQPMNQKSVIDAFQILPAVNGQFSWNGNTLVFDPDQDLEKGSSYEVTVHESARSVYRRALAEAFRQTFNVLNYPEVVVAAPADKSVIMQDQRLTVLFDHPIRTLSRETEAPKLLNIEPEVNGKYLWLGTSGFEFVPNSGWPAASSFKVTVPMGTKMADGGTTTADYTWSFQTQNLAVSSPDAGAQHNVREPVRLSFNYPVNPDAVRKALVVRIAGTMKPVVLDNQTFTFAADKKDANTILVMKKGSYDLGDTYTFELAAGFTADLGPLGLPEAFNATVTTDEKGFRLTGSDPSEGGSKCVYCSVTLYFNNPVDIELARKQIAVSPTVSDLEISSYESNHVFLYGHWKPSTTYTITLGKDLADIYGQKQAKVTKLAVKTDQFDPAAELAGYSIHGVLAASMPRVYQLRGINLKGAVKARLCSQTLDQYVSNRSATNCGIDVNMDFPTNGKQNEYQIIEIDLDRMAGQKLPLGAYHLNLSIPELRRPYFDAIYDRELLVVNTALTVKQDSSGKVLVWATDMQTGQPVANLPVTVWEEFDRCNNCTLHKLDVKKTNKDGLVEFQSMSSSLGVSAQDDTHLGFSASNWNDGISVWNYGLQQAWYPGNEIKAHHIGYTYTDRMIYRPEQTVYFKGVIRLDTDAKLTVPTLKTVKASITDPEGKVVYDQEVPVSAFGTFHGEMKLDGAASLGTYSISTYVEGDPRQGSDIKLGTFDVRQYRRPDFKVEMTEPNHSVVSGEPITIPVHAEYYHGIALGGAHATYSVNRRQLYFQPMPGEWYSYTDDDNMFDCWWYCRTESDLEYVSSGELTLDANGNGVITVPSNLTDYKFSATYSIDVTVTDVNDRSVSGNLELPVHRGDYYLGVRADYSAGWNATTADFEVVSVNHDGSVRGNVSAQVKFYKRTWSSVKKDNGNDATFWDWEKNDTLIETKSIETDGQGKAKVSFTTSESGEFVARVEGTDARGNTIAASVNRYVYHDDIGGAVRVTDDHQMKIVQNKASYEVGETASLVVQTPYKNTKALLTIERENIREYRVIDLGSESRVIDIPIKDDATPNIYVSVLAVQGGGEKDVPEFRLGYADLQVSTANKVLNVKVTPDKKAYVPGEKVTLTVEASDRDGKPADAEVSMAVVDERVVALLGSVDKNILGKFWFPRDIGVQTAQSLTMLVKKVFFATEGGAGGKGGDGGAPAVRTNFQDTAYWNATVQTGSSGKTTISFNLPDNITSWQILSIGETKDTVVGSAETKIVTRRDLIVEPLLPRLIRYNDKATIGATVFNSTDRLMTVTVKLTADGLALKDFAAKQVTVGAQSRGVVSWNVAAPEQGSSANIKVEAQSGGLQDGFSVSLPLMDYSVAESVTASGILEKNVTENIEIPDDILKTVGNLSVAVQPNIGNGLQNGLNYLVEYPYGCAEQKTSDLLANLMYAELVKLKVSKDDAAKLEEAKKNVEEAIRSILTMQHYDGGFGFWPESEFSYPYLTSYVFWGLTQAQKAGYHIDPTVLDSADRYLRDALTLPPTDNRAFSDTEKAQVIFMLSERSTSGLAGYAATLYDRRATLPAFAQAFLAMTYHNIERAASSAHASRLMDDLHNRLVYIDPSTAYLNEDPGYDWYWSTDLRSSSIYLMALMRMDPKTEDVERILRYVVHERKDGYWETTQNTAMAMLSIVDYVRAHPIDERATEVALFLDNQPQPALSFPQGDVSGQDTRFFGIPSLLKSGASHQVGLEKDSDKRFFYDITMKTYRAIEDIEPFENGFTVISDAYALNDDKYLQPLTQAKVGDTVRVRMKLLVSKKRSLVAFEDHLPAGLEAIDFSLKTSPKDLAGIPQQCVPDWSGKERCISPNSYEWGWWWENVWKHIEFRDDRVFLFAEHLEPGVYEYEFLAKAVTPGEFRVPPARAYEFYNPQANGHNEGKIFKVTAK